MVLGGARDLVQLVWVGLIFVLRVVLPLPPVGLFVHLSLLLGSQGESSMALKNPADPAPRVPLPLRSVLINQCISLWAVFTHDNFIFIELLLSFTCNILLTLQLDYKNQLLAKYRQKIFDEHSPTYN